MDKGTSTAIAMAVMGFLLLVQLIVRLLPSNSKKVASPRRGFDIASLVVEIPILILAWLAFETASASNKNEDVILNTIFGVGCLGIVVFFVVLDLKTVMHWRSVKKEAQKPSDKDEPKAD